MLVTLIRYTVEAPNREKFLEEQRLWQRLHGVDGFIWRGGGWSAEDKATVIGVWRDKDAHRTFNRASKRSLVIARSGRAHSRVVTLPWESREEIRGLAPNLRLALARARCVCAELFHVRPDRVGHYVKEFDKTWKPAISTATGMLGGVLCEGDDHWFMHVTAWRDQTALDIFRRKTEPVLMDETDAREDCLEGRRYPVTVQPEFTVRG